MPLNEHVVIDQDRAEWRLVDHRDAASLLVFLRGDW